MALRFRPMRREDIPECVEIVRAHPILGPRHGNSMGDLSAVCLSLLGREAFRAVVFEDAKDSQVLRVGAGVSVFVSYDFLADLKNPPCSWMCPDRIDLLVSGVS